MRPGEVNTLGSYYYLELAGPGTVPEWLPASSKTFLDSGAYSAWSLGKQINLEQYASYLQRLPFAFTEVAALDVIGNPKLSLEYALKMREVIPSIIPCFHIGEDWGYLNEYKSFDKVALGGMVGHRDPKLMRKWIEQCFARLWPKKIHLFGIRNFDILAMFPFHSLDNSDWSKFVARYRYTPTTKRQFLRRVDCDQLGDTIVSGLECLDIQAQITALWSSKGVSWDD